MLACKKRSMQSDSAMDALHKEWDDVLCSICMEHPHNAVLLICSSHEKGCRPYVCDTSYRHSNCLDRYRNVKLDSPINQQNPNNTPVRSRRIMDDTLLGIFQSTAPVQNALYDVVAPEPSLAIPEKVILKCPLCRGDVQGWNVAEEERKFLDMKARSCSNDSCDFEGDYQELRKHARIAHPSLRPAEIDPSRQQAWRRLEVQRDNADVVSAIRSTMPGAVVMGDYVLEGGNDDRNTTERGWTPFFLFQMVAEARRHARGGRSASRRVNEDSFRERYLNMLGLGLLDESDDENNDANEPSRHRRRRDEANVPQASEAMYRRMYLEMLGLRDESDDTNGITVNHGQPSVRRRRRGEANVINIDDDDDGSEDLPVQRRPRLTQTEPNEDEL